jgi:hypothetical protein
MNLYALFALCFIPPVTFFLIFIILVPGFKIRFGLRALFVGLLSLVPITFIQYFVLILPVFNQNTFSSLLITSFIFNGLIEETIKMVLLLLLPRKKTTIAVFFAASLLCGLSIGSFESLIYLVKHFQEAHGSAGSAYNLIFIRMITAVVIHTFCTGLSGLFVWMWRKKTPHISPFVYAATLHGAYNFFTGFSSFFHFFAIIAILFVILECHIWYKWIILPDTGVDIKRNYK